MRRAWLLVAVIVLGGWTGCLGGDVGSTSEGLGTAEASDARDEDGLSLEGEDCMLGGGQSVHPREIPGWNVSSVVPEPWRVADVIEDTGEQHTYSEVPDPTSPKPEEGETWGHYHASLVCQAWWLDDEPREDLVFGFVGPKVATPAFVDAGADDAYLATVLGTNDDRLYEKLQRHGIDAMRLDVSVERVEEQIAIGMDTDHNGEYLSAYRLAELGPIEDEHVRLWSQHENPDGTITPIGLDLYREGGTHHGDAGEGYFHHSRTANHWPMPGAYGHTAAAHYDGFDVSLTWGPTPDVTIEQAYVH